MEKNTQQPVAWCELTQSGKIGYFDGKPLIMVGDVGNDCHQTPLFTYPPVPRDVLMAALGDCRAECAKHYLGDADDSQINLAAIADRYASQVQPEQPYAADAAMEGMKRLGYQWRDGAWFKKDAAKLEPVKITDDAILEIGKPYCKDVCHIPVYSFNEREFLAIARRIAAANQPEPVNQQLLQVLNSLVDGGAFDLTDSPKSLVSNIKRILSEALAIASAEAAQPLEQRECGCGWRGESADCVWCGNVGPLCPKCHETTEEAQQPASAQPVAVPDAEIIQCFETEMAHNPAAYDQPGEVVYQITQKELVRAARAMLSAAQKPEGV